VNEKSPEVLSKIESVWYKYDQNHPFIYEYLDNRLDTLYSREEKMLTLFMYFSGLILFIACMGLFALAAYTAEQKTKENGVRKVLGGSVAHIVKLQLNETSRLVLLAGIIATPLTWYFMNRWLQDFAYSISIGWIYFAIGMLSALLIAVLTVVYIAWRSTRLNPVEALRYE
jgi:putative ABC transport system permease protein